MSSTILGWTRAALAALMLAAARPVPALMVQCDGCSDLQMQQHLRDLAGSYVDVTGTTHVADFEGNVLRSYEVQCNQWRSANEREPGEADSGPAPVVRFWGCPQMTITPATTPPAASEQFGVLRAFYLDTGGTWSKQLSAPVWAEWQLGGPAGGYLGGRTAFDIAGTPIGVRQQLGDALTNHCAMCGLPQLALLANALASALINTSASIIVTVRFHDGSTVEYVLVFGQNSEFTYVQGSARTDDGLLIPDFEQLAGPGSATWFIPGGSGDGYALVDYLERVRPGFVGPAPIGTGADDHVLACT
jgi:hypothetical protein